MGPRHHGFAPKPSAADVKPLANYDVLILADASKEEITTGRPFGRRIDALQRRRSPEYRGWRRRDRRDHEVRENAERSSRFNNASEYVIDNFTCRSGTRSRSADFSVPALWRVRVNTRSVTASMPRRPRLHDAARIRDHRPRRRNAAVVLMTYPENASDILMSVGSARGAAHAKAAAVAMTYAKAHRALRLQPGTSRPDAATFPMLFDRCTGSDDHRDAALHSRKQKNHAPQRRSRRGRAVICLADDRDCATGILANARDNARLSTRCIGSKRMSSRA